MADEAPSEPADASRGPAPRLLRAPDRRDRDGDEPVAPSPCLNCGWAGALEFCPRCGQRNVPREQYDLRGLAGEYAMQVVGKMKLLRTLWTLIRHPGQLTAAFMDGKRIEQVNPLWLYLFVWSTVVTIAQLVWQPESGAMLQELSGNPDMQWFVESAKEAQPYTLIVLSYGSPLLSLVLMTGLVRLLFSGSWIESVVFTLHCQTVGILISLPTTLTTAIFGFWSDVALLNSALGIASWLVAVLYEWIAVRRVFATHVDRLVLRFIGMHAVGFVVSLGLTMVLTGTVLFGLIALFQLVG